MFFHLNENAPHWNIWQKNLKHALKSGEIWGSEQISMNITIYVDKIPEMNYYQHIAIGR